MIPLRSCLSEILCLDQTALGLGSAGGVGPTSRAIRGAPGCVFIMVAWSFWARVGAGPTTDRRARAQRGRRAACALFGLLACACEVGNEVAVNVADGYVALVNRTRGGEFDFSTGLLRSPDGVMIPAGVERFALVWSAGDVRASCAPDDDDVLASYPIRPVLYGEPHAEARRLPAPRSVVDLDESGSNFPPQSSQIGLWSTSDAHSVAPPPIMSHLRSKGSGAVIRERRCTPAHSAMPCRSRYVASARPGSTGRYLGS